MVIKEERGTVAGWDDHEIYTQRIRNYTAKPIDVEIRRAFPGHVVFRSQLEPKLHDYQTVEFTAQVPAGKRADLLVRSRPQPGYERQAEQRDAGGGGSEAVKLVTCHWSLVTGHLRGRGCYGTTGNRSMPSAGAGSG